MTVVYDAKDTQKVAGIARSRGVKPSEIYRDALDYYLAAQAQPTWRADFRHFIPRPGGSPTNGSLGLFVSDRVGKVGISEANRGGFEGKQPSP